MAEEVHQKRLRDDSPDSETPESNSTPNPKRQKPYHNNNNNILSLLDEDEQEELFLSLPTQDLSAIVTTLQQELSPSAAFDFEPPPFSAEEHHQTTAADVGAEDDGVKSVIRHLLEASDDELGIPNTDCGTVEAKSDDFPFGFVDNGLWELEDVAANYYTVLQAELFM